MKMSELTDNPPNYPFNTDLEISVVETKKLHDAGGDDFLLLDVRETHELAISAIEGATHIPMGDIPGAMGELDIEEDTTVAVLCRTGKRSLDVAMYLHAQGFTGARSIAGGIHWWSDRLDQSLTKY
jgi:rhodanese-related sulfurtransferase